MKLISFLLDLIFPIKCISCGNEGKYICSSCEKNIRLVEYQECPHCRNTTFSGGFCSNKCAENYFFDNLIICTHYSANSIIKPLIKKFKYKNNKGLYLFLGQLLQFQFEQLKFSFSGINEAIIVPVPIAKKKFRERGYNQCVLMAKELSLRTGLRFSDILFWIKYDGQQAGKNIIQRKNSRTNCIDVKKKFLNFVLDKNFLLIDDVAATASTVNECARALKKHGANKVLVFVISRAKKFC